MAKIKKSLKKAQNGMDTKLKDVPGKVMAAGKKVVDRVKNATVRDAVDIIAPGLGTIADKLKKEKPTTISKPTSSTKPYSPISRPSVPQFPPPASNRPSATRTKLRPKAKPVGSPKAAGLKSNIKAKDNDDMRVFLDKNGGTHKKKMRNGGSLSGLKASTKRVGPVDPNGAWTRVQERTLAGAKGKAKLVKDKQLGATKMTAKAGKKVSKK